MTATDIVRAAALAGVCVALTACAGLPTKAVRDRDVTRSVLYEDARLTHAYNNCELQTLHRMFNVNSAQYLADGRTRSPLGEARHAICGKWRREVVPASLHVYPLNASAAVQVGAQRFCPLHAQTCDTRPSQFVAVWLQNDLDWQITELISFPQQSP